MLLTLLPRRAVSGDCFVHRCRKHASGSILNCSQDVRALHICLAAQGLTQHSHLPCQEQPQRFADSTGSVSGGERPHNLADGHHRAAAARGREESCGHRYAGAEHADAGEYQFGVEQIRKFQFLVAAATSIFHEVTQTFPFLFLSTLLKPVSHTSMSGWPSPYLGATSVGSLFCSQPSGRGGWVICPGWRSPRRRGRSCSCSGLVLGVWRRMQHNAHTPPHAQTWLPLPAQLQVAEGTNPSLAGTAWACLPSPQGPELLPTYCLLEPSTFDERDVAQAPWTR